MKPQPRSWPLPQGTSGSRITRLPVEGQGTGKSSQMGCTAEDLRNQLPCYWGAGRRLEELDWGRPLRLQVQEGSEVTPGTANCRVRGGRRWAPGVGVRGGGKGAGLLQERG